jgi:hypothetical protein
MVCIYQAHDPESIHGHGAESPCLAMSFILSDKVVIHDLPGVDKRCDLIFSGLGAGRTSAP